MTSEQAKINFQKQGLETRKKLAGTTKSFRIRRHIQLASDYWCIKPVLARRHLHDAKKMIEKNNLYNINLLCIGIHPVVKESIKEFINKSKYTKI